LAVTRSATVARETIVVGVGDGATVVHDDCALEFGLACFLTLVDDPVFAVSECGRREISRGLDEAGLQSEFLTNVRVRLVVEYVFDFRDVVGVVVPSMISDMLGGVSELLEHLIENALIVLRNVEFELDVPNNLHTS
jgi:hypothetical protein